MPCQCVGCHLHPQETHSAWQPALQSSLGQQELAADYAFMHAVISSKARAVQLLQKVHVLHSRTCCEAVGQASAKGMSKSSDMYTWSRADQGRTLFCLCVFLSFSCNAFCSAMARACLACSKSSSALASLRLSQRPRSLGLAVSCFANRSAITTWMSAPLHGQQDTWDCACT